MKCTKSKKGFTLVELSIVLVIISLIVASVLVGQDLIRAAEINKLISEHDDYASAVATFRLRYNGLAGDIDGSVFGFSGDGDNNGVLDPGIDDASSLAATSENVYFWSHLGATGAQLISGSFTPALFDVSTDNMDDILPESAIGTVNWGVYANSSIDVNYFVLGPANDSSNGTDGKYNTEDALTPLDAYSIDIKLDDGLPNQGYVRAGEGSNTDAWTLPDGDTTCANSGVEQDSGTYNLDATAIACTLRFEMRY
ncbi:MAG: hypothetical protein CMH30_03185 [Micavibrio sp.]|nr:hypothetical protein [Micavibrio sp.]